MSTIRPRSAAISHKQAHRLGSVRHRAFEMRNAADDIDAHVERADRVFHRGRIAQNAVLREGDELQVEIVLYLFPNLKQRLNALQFVVAGIDMAADGADPHGHGQIDIAQRAVR